ncbi:MAG: hypothetical protein RSA57_03780 [Cetobacterium sp.]|uniref:hypothetical protein n=1 Tax=Bacteria TaxID=2 RepID=UPI002FCC167B
MNKKIMTIVIVIVFILSVSYVTYSKVKNISKEKEATQEITNENKAEKEKTNEIKNNNESESNDKYPVEDGFLTTIKLGGTEEEIRKNNNLRADSRVSVEDQLNAKNVAENFIQAIVSFNIDEPKVTVDRATKHVVPEIKEEVESLFINLGKFDTVKKSIVVEIRSTEKQQDQRNNYLTFNITVLTNVVDKYGQQVDGAIPTYEVKVLKIDGVWKIVQYYLA